MRQYKKAQQAQKVVMAGAGIGYVLPAEEKADAWTDKFDSGPVRVLLYVEKCPIRNSFRILVANKGARRDEEQWIPAEKISDAIKCLLDADKVYKKAKRHLEGGILRRVIRTLF